MMQHLATTDERGLSTKQRRYNMVCLIMCLLLTRCTKCTQQ